MWDTSVSPQMREVKLLRCIGEDVAAAFGNNAAWK